MYFNLPNCSLQNTFQTCFICKIHYKILIYHTCLNLPLLRGPIKMKNKKCNMKQEA